MWWYLAGRHAVVWCRRPGLGGWVGGAQRRTRGVAPSHLLTSQQARRARHAGCIFLHEWFGHRAWVWWVGVGPLTLTRCAVHVLTATAQLIVYVRAAGTCSRKQKEGCWL